jgi:hypothetical protein
MKRLEQRLGLTQNAITFNHQREQVARARYVEGTWGRAASRRDRQAPSRVIDRGWVRSRLPPPPSESE